jgi:hypothetical protein
MSGSSGALIVNAVLVGDWIFKAVPGRETSDFFFSLFIVSDEYT